MNQRLAAEPGSFVNGLTGGRDVQKAYKEQHDQYRLCQSSVLAKIACPHPQSAGVDQGPGDSCKVPWTSKWNKKFM